MISKLALLLFLFLFSVHSLSDFKNDIKISSDTIEFLKKSNQINFFNNVEINSKFVKINAQIAAYDEIEDVISLIGKPSTIESNKDGSSFDGKAEKIIFYTNENVQLIVNASIKYENISISSNMIIFNPETGQISSE